MVMFSFAEQNNIVLLITARRKQQVGRKNKTLPGKQF